MCNINKSFIFLQQVEVSMSCLVVDKHDVVNLGSTGNFPHKSECTSPPKSLALFPSRTLGYFSSRSWHRYMIFKKKRWLARRYAFEMNSSGELVFDELFRGLEGDMTHTSMQLIRCRYLLCYASCSFLVVNSIHLSWTSIEHASFLLTSPYIKRFPPPNVAVNPSFLLIPGFDWLLESTERLWDIFAVVVVSIRYVFY